MGIVVLEYLKMSVLRDSDFSHATLSWNVYHNSHEPSSAWGGDRTGFLSTEVIFYIGCSY